MGIIKRGILGGFSNKVANVVGTSWKGRAVIKALPLSVANPRTTPQVNQRTKFSACSKLFSEILGDWVKPLWDRFSGDISGYNAVVKANVAGFGTTGIPDYGALVMSKGKMATPSIDTIVADVSLGTVVTLVDLPADAAWGGTGLQVFVLAINENSGNVLGVTVGTGNSGGSSTVTINSTDFEAGDEIIVFVALKRADGTQVSPSLQSAIIAIA